MSARTLSWPDSAVHTHVHLPRDKQMSIPFAVHVFVFHTRAQLREACGDPRASAHSMTHRPDAEGTGAVIMLSAEELELSLVAHEVAHVALHWWATRVPKKKSARRAIKRHPERVAEMVGNLTALVWYTAAPQPA